mmetsp:Transcript_39677/g.93195  ORF Transcript_39677/g.93195 Transcript_39677/m.93195 type:complete len:223 (-) Transcript_39677:173-841(-)
MPPLLLVSLHRTFSTSWARFPPRPAPYPPPYPTNPMLLLLLPVLQPPPPRLRRRVGASGRSWRCLSRWKQRPLSRCAPARSGADPVRLSRRIRPDARCRESGILMVASLHRTATKEALGLGRPSMRRFPSTSTTRPRIVTSKHLKVTSPRTLKATRANTNLRRRTLINLLRMPNRSLSTVARTSTVPQWGLKLQPRLPLARGKEIMGLIGTRPPRTARPPTR